MGNFERLSVLVIVVIIVLIVVIALVQLTESNETTLPSSAEGPTQLVVPGDPGMGSGLPPTSIFVPTPGPGRIGFERFVEPVPPPPGPVEPPKPEPVVAKVEEPKVHVVQPGETIAKIAKGYFPSAVTKGTDAILRANPTVDPMRMRTGTKLTIPVMAGATPANGGTLPASDVAIERPPAPTNSITPGGTYTTKKGESLASISRRAYRGREDRWQDLWLANYDALDAESLEKLPGGIRLKIPR